MPRYRVTVTAALASPIGVDAFRLRALTGGTAKVVAPGVATITVVQRGSNAECAADRAVSDIQRAVSPLMTMSRPPTWYARPTGWRRLSLRGARGGFSTGGWTDDDGLGGVREPRRPLPSSDWAAAAVDPEERAAS